MYKKILAVLSLTLVFGISTVTAQERQPYESFRDTALLSTNSTKLFLTPTVVEIPFAGDNLNQNSFLVVDTATGNYLPHYWRDKVSKIKTTFRITSNRSILPRLYDGRQDTNHAFRVNEGEQGLLQLDITGDQEFSTSEITFSFDKNVTPPQMVTVYSVSDDGNQTIVLARTNFQGSRVLIPKVTTRTLQVVLEYYQPLRISEVSLVEEDQSVEVSQGLRFLAIPNKNYEILLNPDQTVSVNRTESGNLRSDTGVRVIDVPPITKNPKYKESDRDSDTVLDSVDNCPDISNQDQMDTDGNRTGDVCDDYDKDGIVNSLDNCPSEPNRNQSDEDGDSVGDVCDNDESRITEKYAWALWVVMALAGGIIIALFVVVMRRDPQLQAKQEDAREE